MPRSSVPPQAVAAAARELGGDPAGLRRLSSGTSNAVWSLDRPGVVLAGYGPRHDPGVLAARVDVARELSARLPFVRPVGDGLLHAGLRQEPVGVWERLELLPGGPDWRRVGEVLRRLHDVPLDALPGARLLPDLHDVGPVLQEVAALRRDRLAAPQVTDVLAAVAARLGEELRGLPPVRVLVHGDLHPPNVLTTAGGVVLCDLDELGRAHPWWDLAFVLDPGRQPGLSVGDRAALLTGYGAPGPDPDQVLTMSRVAHLRRTVRELRWGAGGPLGAVWDRLRTAGWEVTLQDWSAVRHPVFLQPRATQLGLLLRSLRRTPPGRARG